MKDYKLFQSVLVFSLVLLIGGPGLQAAPLQAEIGVLVHTAGMKKRASVRQKLRKSDQLQLHVKPGQNQYLYLIAFNGMQAKLIKKAKVVAGQVKILPGKDKFMQVQGKTTQPRWLVVLSSDRHAKLEQMAASPLSASRWMMLEKKLLQEGRPVLTDQGKNPTSIAANMRSAEQSVLRAYTGGSNLLALQYNFRVIP